MPALPVADAFRHAVQLHQSGRVAEADGIYRQILAIEPTHADALHLAGVAAQQLQRGDEAVALIQRAIALRGDNAEYHHNLGELWRQQGRPADAIGCVREAIRLAPNFVAAHNTLGVLLLRAGDFAAAETALREAVRLRPDFAEAWINLGCVHERQGNLPTALTEFQAAVRAQPPRAIAHLHLGRLLLTLDRVEDAMQSFRACLAVDPRSADACNDIANALKDQGDLDGALRWYQRALELMPGHAVAHSNFVYTALFHPAFDAAALQREHEGWQTRHAAELEAQPPAHRTRREARRRLRIGYVSPSFSTHVVGWNMLPLFRHHDRARFEIACYSDVMRADAATGEFRALADRWVDCVSWTDEQLAARIVDDEIDILVDLTLHLAQHRLLAFARRPAPVQVTFAGYPGTTGLKSIQYRLSDGYLDPETAPLPYSEATIRLQSFWCFQPRGDEPEVAPPPSQRAGHLTFGCLNNFCKVTAPALALWVKVLQAVPDSRLLLLAAAGDHRQRTLAYFAHAGIAASRIEFVGRLPHRDYIATYQRIDVALDTLPYNGHTTSCDALWMGVPVVTLVGGTIVGRAGLSQLSNLGLPELVAHSPAQFVTIATALAADPQGLAGLRATLRDRMQCSPLMDAAGFTRDIERHYSAIWERASAAEGTSATP